MLCQTVTKNINPYPFSPGRAGEFVEKLFSVLLLREGTVGERVSLQVRVYAFQDIILHHVIDFGSQFGAQNSKHFSYKVGKEKVT